MGAESYAQRIQELNIDELFKKTVSNIQEANMVLTQIRNIQKSLHQIKREMNVEIKAVRASYREESTSAGTGGFAMLALLGKRKAAGSYRASAKRQLVIQRDQQLAPYEQLKLNVDGILVALDEVKVHLNRYAEQIKIDEHQKQDISDVNSINPLLGAEISSCSRCGAQIQKDDKFCHNCGHDLQIVIDEVPPPPSIYPPGILEDN